MKCVLTTIGIAMALVAVGALAYAGVWQYGKTKKLSDADPRLARQFAESSLMVSIAGILVAIAFVVLEAADRLE